MVHFLSNQLDNRYHDKFWVISAKKDTKFRIPSYAPKVAGYDYIDVQLNYKKHHPYSEKEGIGLSTVCLVLAKMLST